MKRHMRYPGRPHITYCGNFQRRRQLDGPIPTGDTFHGFKTICEIQALAFWLTCRLEKTGISVAQTSLWQRDPIEV